MEAAATTELSEDYPAPFQNCSSEIRQPLPVHREPGYRQSD